MANGEERENRRREVLYLRVTAWFTAAGVIASAFGVWLGLRQTKTSFEMGQRAWVTVKNLQLMPVGGKDAPPMPLTADIPNTVVLVFHNGGQSPAVQFRVNTQTDLFKGVACKINTLDSPYQSETMTVGPGQEPADYIAQFTPTPECVAAINTGNATLRIRGTATYQDIFHIEHHTDYCYQYEGLRMHSLSACSAGNDID